MKAGSTLTRRNINTFNQAIQEHKEDGASGGSGTSNKINETDKFDSLTEIDKRRDTITHDNMSRHESTPEYILGQTNRLVNEYDEFIKENQRSKKDIFKGKNKTGVKQMIKQKDKFLQQKQIEREESMNNLELDAQLDVINLSGQFYQGDYLAPKSVSEDTKH